MSGFLPLILFFLCVQVYGGYSEEEIEPGAEIAKVQNVTHIQNFDLDTSENSTSLIVRGFKQRFKNFFKDFGKNTGRYKYRPRYRQSFSRRNYGTWTPEVGYIFLGTFLTGTTIAVIIYLLYRCNRKNIPEPSLVMMPAKARY